MATINRGLVVSSAIANSATVAASPSNLVTLSSGQYAIVQLEVEFTPSGSSTWSISIGGQLFHSETGSSNTTTRFQNLIIGPSQSLTLTPVSGTQSTIGRVSGVVLANSS